MELKIQIISLFVSFLFGIFLFVMVKINYKYLFSVKNNKLKVLFNFIFCLDLSLLYFLILYFLNNGTLHMYFLLLIIFGFLLSYNFSKKLM